MLIIGLHGRAGVGKDTIADYLVRKYGFVKFACADPLRREVQAAFSLPDLSLFEDRSQKEVPTERLSLINCQDDEFVGRVIQLVADSIVLEPGTLWRNPLHVPLSPRQIMQWWGTEYRRGQNPRYWLDRNDDFLEAARKSAPYPEHAPACFVVPDVRFPNERAWVHEHRGNVWHIHKGDAGAVHRHVSETGLPKLHGERELYNNGTIERLYYGVDLMFQTAAEFVRVEPMETLPQQAA
jgi:hypothetical protein